MKTTISLPEALFRRADRHAKRTRRSRSQLYADALAEYLARHTPDAVTADMNAVVDGLGDQEADAFSVAAARRVMKDAEW